MPPIYIITLKETADRYARSKAYFDQSGLYYKFFFGYTEHLGIKPTQVNRDYNMTSSAKLALNLGHLTLMRALLLTDAEEFIILEDDCFFTVDNFVEEFEKSYAALPADWDVAYLGYCCTENLQKTVVNDRISIMKYPLCTHSILYKRRAIEIYIEKSGIINDAVDIAWYHSVFPYVNLYCFDPPMTNQRTITEEWENLLP